MKFHKYTALRRRQIRIETEAWEQVAKEYRELLADMCEQKLAPRSTVHPPPPPVLCPVRSPCQTTPRLLPSVLGLRPSSRRLRQPRRRPSLPVAASRLPLSVTTSRPPASSSSRRSPSLRPPPWSRRLQLPVSACHLCLHHRLPRPRPRSSSPPPL
jgi:hypothetical protein